MELTLPKESQFLYNTFRMILKVCLLSLTVGMGLVAARSFRVVNGDDVGHIVGNKLHVHGNYSYMVRLSVVTPYIAANGSRRYKISYCGGSLLELDVVLTAGHCVSNKTTNTQMYVEAGLTTLNVNQTSVQLSFVKKYAIHETFSEGQFIRDDLALLFLYKPFNLTSMVTPISLPTRNYTMGSMVSTVGWGMNEHGRLPTWLQTTNFTIIPRSQCQKYSPLKVADKMICVFNKGVSVVCRGDSGGPLVYKNKLIGVTSWVMALILYTDGTISCSANHPAVYVNVYEYIDWINNTIKKYK